MDEKKPQKPQNPRAQLAETNVKILTFQPDKVSLASWLAAKSVEVVTRNVVG